MEYVFNVDAPAAPPGININVMREDLRPLVEEWVKRFEKERGYRPLTHAYYGLANVLPLFTDILPRVIERFGKVDSEGILKVAWDIDIPNGGTPAGYGL
jgi:hypothetical protein